MLCKIQFKSVNISVNIFLCITISHTEYTMCSFSIYDWCMPDTTLSYIMMNKSNSNVFIWPVWEDMFHGGCPLWACFCPLSQERKSLLYLIHLLVTYLLVFYCFLFDIIIQINLISPKISCYQKGKYYLGSKN